MPCSDGGPSPEQAREPRNIEAALCGILGVLEGAYGGPALEEVLCSINWTEVGVSRSWFDAWWNDHKHRDSVRRKREQQEREDNALCDTALDKLSADEVRALRRRGGFG